MKRYLIFAGDQYYPRGGMRDCIGSADTYEEAQTLLKEHEYAPFDWHHTFDRLDEAKDVDSDDADLSFY